MVIDKTSRCGTEWVAQEPQWQIGTEGGRRRSGLPLLWGGGDPPVRKQGRGGSEGQVGGGGRVGGWVVAGVGKVGGPRGVVRATVWSELSAVGQLSAPLSSLRSASHTIYLAVKRPAALALPRPPSWITPPARLHPSLCILHLSGGCTGAPLALLSRLRILPALLFGDLKHLQLDT